MQPKSLSSIYGNICAKRSPVPVGGDDESDNCVLQQIKVMTIPTPTEVFLTEKRHHDGGCFHCSWRCLGRGHPKSNVVSMSWKDLQVIIGANGMRPCKHCFDPAWVQLYEQEGAKADPSSASILDVTVH